MLVGLAVADEVQEVGAAAREREVEVGEVGRLDPRAAEVAADELHLGRRMDEAGRALVLRGDHVAARERDVLARRHAGVPVPPADGELDSQRLALLITARSVPARDHQLPRDAPLVGDDEQVARPQAGIDEAPVGLLEEDGRRIEELESGPAQRAHAGPPGRRRGRRSAPSRPRPARRRRRAGTRSPSGAPARAAGVSTRTSKRRPSFSGAAISSVMSGARASRSTSSTAAVAAAARGAAVSVRAAVATGTTRVTRPHGPPVGGEGGGDHAARRPARRGRRPPRGSGPRSERSASTPSDRRRIGASVMTKWCVATSQTSRLHRPDTGRDPDEDLLDLLAVPGGGAVRVDGDVEHGARGERRLADRSMCGVRRTSRGSAASAGASVAGALPGRARPAAEQRAGRRSQAAARAGGRRLAPAGALRRARGGASRASGAAARPQDGTGDGGRRRRRAGAGTGGSSAGGTATSGSIAGGAGGSPLRLFPAPDGRQADGRPVRVVEVGKRGRRHRFRARCRGWRFHPFGRRWRRCGLRRFRSRRRGWRYHPFGRRWRRYGLRWFRRRRGRFQRLRARRRHRGRTAASGPLGSAAAGGVTAGSAPVGSQRRYSPQPPQKSESAAFSWPHVGHMVVAAGAADAGAVPATSGGSGSGAGPLPRGPRRRASSSDAAAAEANRCSGSRARSRSTQSPRAGGRPGTSDRSGGTSPVARRYSNATAVSLSWKGTCPLKHLVGDAAEGVQVRPRAGRAAHRLLRRRIGDRPDREIRRRHGPLRVLRQRSGGSEVADPHAPGLRDEEVLRLDVAMHDPEPRGRAEARQRVLHHGDRLLEREAADDAPEGAALLVAHGDAGRPLRVEHLVDAHDVGVVEPPRDVAGGLEEPRLPGGVRARHPELLERHDDPRLAVTREVDDARRPSTELADDLVAPERAHSARRVALGRRAAWARVRRHVNVTADEPVTPTPVPSSLNSPLAPISAAKPISSSSKSPARVASGREQLPERVQEAPEALVQALDGHGALDDAAHRIAAIPPARRSFGRDDRQIHAGHAVAGHHRLLGRAASRKPILGPLIGAKGDPPARRRTEHQRAGKRLRVSRVPPGREPAPAAGSDLPRGCLGR